jgi:hypothetical protein
MNISPIFSGSMSRPNKKTEKSTSTGYLLHAGFLLGLLLNPEDGGDMFLRNIA